MAQNPLSIFEKYDPELLKKVMNDSEFTYSDGALPKKTKLLIGLALDAADGAAEGVAALARQAIQAGATKQEIAETIRVAGSVKGVASIYTAAAALNILEK